MTSEAPFDGSPDFLRTKKRAILFLRWVVIVTASYLVLFAAPSSTGDPRISLFITVFLASNVVASFLPAHLYESNWLRTAFVLFDTAWISLGMVLAGESQSELFLLYFSVLFVAALGESEAMIAGGCALISLLYLLFLLHTKTPDEVLKSSVLLRFPFLFGISTFYGYLVTVAKEERRAAELARDHERYRTDLLATLTHDLQTPLSAIASLADVLLAAPEVFDARERRRVSEAIKQAATESAELVGNFLAMASAEAGAKTNRRRPVDLNLLAKEVLHHHRRLAAEKEIRLDARLVESLPPISGNQALLRRAITNLLRNAIKFVPCGGRIELTTGLDGGAVTLTVSDNGPGIPEGLREQLFERYVSDDEQTGTGLGLFIVRLVAEAHGGSVSVFSQPGKGSRFAMRFPVPPDVQASETVRRPAPVSTIAAARARALQRS